MLIQGIAMASKPKRCLELGYGEGVSYEALRTSRFYNTVGEVHIVDNWLDFNGKPQTFYPWPWLTIITANEKDFLKGCASDQYDLIVSDADHSGTWFEEHFRVAREGANLFFHDVTNPNYPNLMGALDLASHRGYPWQLFNKSTFQGERCERGLLWVQKKDH